MNVLVKKNKKKGELKKMASIKFKVNGMVIGKEFKKAVEKFTDKNGREVAAQPDRHFLVCAFGETNSDGIFVGVPTIRLARVSKDTFESVSDVEESEFTVDMVDSLDNYKTKIVAASNFEVL